MSIKRTVKIEGTRLEFHMPDSKLPVIFCYVKPDFFDQPAIQGKSPEEVQKMNFITLAKDHNIGTFFHNETGPAYGTMNTFDKDGNPYHHQEYHIKGIQVDRLKDDEAKKMLHDANFARTVEEIISDDEHAS